MTKSIIPVRLQHYFGKKTIAKYCILARVASLEEIRRSQSEKNRWAMEKFLVWSFQSYSI